jgi:hypothetical protein
MVEDMILTHITTTTTTIWSETTLNYQMMLERYPNLKEEVGSFESRL